MHVHRLVAALASGLVATGFIACGSSEPIPNELVRLWRNPAPAYRDRSFEVQESWVVFGTGEYSSKMYAIEGLESKRSGGRIEYEIEYRADDGEVVPLKLVYTPGPPAELQIGSRKDRWVPDEHAHWLKRGDS